jgi:hypothetical protein
MKMANLFHWPHWFLRIPAQQDGDLLCAPFICLPSACSWKLILSITPSFPSTHTKQGGLKRKGTKEKESERERERQKENKEKKEVDGNMLTGYY